MYYVIAKNSENKRRMCLHLKKKRSCFKYCFSIQKEIKQSEFKQA